MNAIKQLLKDAIEKTDQSIQWHENQAIKLARDVEKNNKWIVDYRAEREEYQTYLSALELIDSQKPE